jgi:hypothetical protein
VETKSKSLIFILAQLVFISSVFAGDWSERFALSEKGEIQFRWRFLESKQKDDTFMEWEFLNTTNEVVTFNYIIISNENETTVGRTTLSSFSRKISGWFLKGNKIVNAEVQGIEFGKKKAKHNEVR